MMRVNSNDIEMRVGRVDFIALEASQTLLFKLILKGPSDEGGQEKYEEYVLKNP